MQHMRPKLTTNSRASHLMYGISTDPFAKTVASAMSGYLEHFPVLEAIPRLPSRWCWPPGCDSRWTTWTWIVTPCTNNQYAR